MVETAIETGMRWGELIALKPCHVDFLRRPFGVRQGWLDTLAAHIETHRLGRDDLPSDRGEPGRLRQTDLMVPFELEEDPWAQAVAGLNAHGRGLVR